MFTRQGSIREKSELYYFSLCVYRVAFYSLAQTGVIMIASAIFISLLPIKKESAQLSRQTLFVQNNLIKKLFHFLEETLIAFTRFGFKVF